MNIVVDKKIAWVVGVNQGIGAEIMQRLISDGIHVVGIDKSKENIPNELQEFSHICDIRDDGQVNQICQNLLRSSPPDYFIHVAGVLHMGGHEEISPEKWRETFAVNLFSPFYFLQHLSPYFKAKMSGNVVVISSNAAHVPRMYMSAYGASKAALTYFTKTVALELASYGVRVNVISPGSTATPMQYQLWKDSQGEQHTILGNLGQFKVGIPLKKIAKVKDIANSVMFLISDQASHITMHDLVIDGGATLGC
ncbi:2,3-dihydro-2,3-dihydroxybenzoate dehydrogenase [Acinetobacter stercoris]|nr:MULTISPECIES: 2,3-dihydro-2,3-dihydroxybenzoate dehydrogenase [Acinetobacter]